eukprot:GHVL01032907.1.p1 GENE.GHVL01032907.1~~GHVL01032907.1.p1  ORF type:complete len:201 (-),score=32.59 GHVL01032907.1:316-918(-)
MIFDWVLPQGVYQFIGSLFIILAVLTVGIIVFLSLYQERILFKPDFPDGYLTPDKNPRGYQSPTQHEMNFENAKIITQDKCELHCWFILHPTNNPNTPTIIFFQGNAGNMGFRLSNMKLLYDNLCCNILMASYRGYSGSTGTPSEKGVYKDAEAALRYVITRGDINEDKIFLYGRSLGGAVAFHLASEHPDKLKGTTQRW